MRVIAVFVAVALAGCATAPRVLVECARQSSGDILITLQRNDRVHGFLDLRVWDQDADRYLWVVNLNYFPTNRLVYGELPVRKPYHHTTQDFPALPGKPELPGAETPFFIATMFQFDSAWSRSACAADAVFRFRMEKDGTITPLGTVMHAADVLERVNEPRPERPRQAMGTLR
jgi:hypothetical protein